MFTPKSLDNFTRVIKPTSSFPVWRKAIYRHLLMAALRSANKKPPLRRYSPESIVPGWLGWYEWRGMCICFVDTEGGEHLHW